MYSSLAGGAGGGQYTATSSSKGELTNNLSNAFGDVNLGGSKISPLMIGLIGLLALGALWIWKR